MWKLLITMVVISNGAPAISTSITSMENQEACNSMVALVHQDSFHPIKVADDIQIYSRSMAKCFADGGSTRTGPQSVPPFFPFPFRGRPQ
jgi:hypothetical protein